MGLWLTPPDLERLNASSKNTIVELLDITFDAFAARWCFSGVGRIIGLDGQLPVRGH